MIHKKESVGVLTIPVAHGSETKARVYVCVYACLCVCFTLPSTSCLPSLPACSALLQSCVMQVICNEPFADCLPAITSHHNNSPEVLFPILFCFVLFCEHNLFGRDDAKYQRLQWRHSANASKPAGCALTDDNGGRRRTKRSIWLKKTTKQITRPMCLHFKDVVAKHKLPAGPVPVCVIHPGCD